MGFKEKIVKLNHHYRQDGLISTLRLLNHRATQAMYSKYPFRYNYPTQITIEIMDICNLRCSHCYLQSQVKLGPPRGFMDYDFFEKIVGRMSPLIKKASIVGFSSIEPLFHERIFDMIDLVMKKNRNITIWINTNGMLLDENKINGLLKRGIYNISISLDGCRKETVESFKTNVDFDRVINNMKKLKERGGDKVRLQTVFVAYKNNIDELMDYIDFCKDLEVAQIKVSGFISYLPEMAGYCLYSESGLRNIDEIFFKARQKANALGIALNYRSTKLEAKGCNLFSTMYIDINGNIVPCNLLSVKTQLVLLDKAGFTEPVSWGNVLEEDPSKIWRSKTSVDFRQLLHDGKLPGECSLCAMGYGVIC